MKRISLLLAVLAMCQFTQAQKYLSRTSELKFDASVPNMVEIAAKNNKVSAILDATTGKFAVNALINEFKFKAPLMEEHFNENYMETSKYPNAKFSGQLINFDASKLANKGTYDVEGDLTLHGVTKKVKTKMTLVLAGGKVSANCNFTVHAQDYKIDIPSLVKEKFAENIKVAFDGDLLTK
jgi:polyisoprenoid-binding protein YceI